MAEESSLSRRTVTVFADMVNCAVSSRGKHVLNKHLKGLIWKLW